MQISPEVPHRGRRLRRRHGRRAARRGEALAATRRAAASGRQVRRGRHRPATRRPNAVTLWTRLHDVEGRGLGQLEVARDRGFRKLSRPRTSRPPRPPTTRSRSRVGGLKAAEEYYYRFETARRPQRRRPLPHRPAARLQRAGPSRSAPARTTPFGYYNAHGAHGQGGRRLHRQPRRLHLRRPYTTVRATGGGRPSPCASTRSSQAVTLEQYRDKYKLYRTDKNLRKMHATFAMVTTWDDHEVNDDYAGAPPRRHPARKRPRRRSSADAYRAFFESMPASRPRAHAAVPHAAVRPQRRPVRARRAPVPRRAALRRRGGNLARPPKYSTTRAPCSAPRGRLPRARLAASNARWKVIANEVPITPIQLVRGLRRPRRLGRLHAGPHRAPADHPEAPRARRRVRHRRHPHVRDLVGVRSR